MTDRKPAEKVGQYRRIEGFFNFASGVSLALAVGWLVTWSFTGHTEWVRRSLGQIVLLLGLAYLAHVARGMADREEEAYRADRPEGGEDGAA